MSGCLSGGHLWTLLSRLCRLLAVPLPVGDSVFSLSWLLPTYFLFAVTYDVLQSLADVAHYLPLYSHSPEPHDHNLTVSLTAANLSALLWSSGSHIKLRRARSRNRQKSSEALHVCFTYQVLNFGFLFNFGFLLSLRLRWPPAHANKNWCLHI